MADNDWRNCHAEAEPANRHPDGVIVGELVGKGLKAADSRQSISPEGRWSRRNRAWRGRSFRPTSTFGRKWLLMPAAARRDQNPGARHAAIKAGDEPNFRLTKGRDHISEIARGEPECRCRTARLRRA